MSFFTDQLNRTIEVNGQPQRIVSLVPSQTELLYDLGLREEVVGITKFCVHPRAWFRSKTRIGGTKTVNIEKIKSLHPDLILANKEENVQEQIEELANHFPVWVSDVITLSDASAMMKNIGHLTNKKEEAQKLVNAISKRFNALPALQRKHRTVYLIWKEPYMTVGGDTFIDNLMTTAGFENVFGHCTRYPAITVEELQDAKPELLLLSTEPYPFKQSHVIELGVHLPRTKILLADGEMFSWYGSRLLHAPAYFDFLQKQVSRMA